MVQGWESRAHLASKRREEARERKQSKKGPQKLNGEVIINQVLKNDLIDLRHHNLEAWVENESGGKALCYSYFRAEACVKHKRCKFSHEFTVSLNRGHEYSDNAENTARSEVHMDCYTNLTAIPSKEYKNLNLLFLDQSCIYDKNNPVVWQQWYEQANSRKQQESEGLQTISEGDSNSAIPDDESIMSMDTATEGGDLDLESSFVTCVTLGGGRKERSGPSSCHLNTLPAEEFNRVFSFLSDVDLCNSYVSALSMKTIILADEEMAYRRKNYLASVTLTSKDLSKQRKQEKKKKMKQANLKDTKKGHKAVKVCRK
jgi:hypothetical protein